MVSKINEKLTLPCFCNDAKNRAAEDPVIYTGAYLKKSDFLKL
jgi:hypothetical protein